MKVAMEPVAIVAANDLNKNVVRDEQFMTAPFSGYLKLSDTGSAAGLQRTLNVGGTAVVSDGTVNTNNRMPLDPDDTIIDGVEVFSGQQIFLAVRNTTGGALTYRGRIILEQAQEY